MKTSDEFPSDMYRYGVSDSAYRAHHEGISWSNKHLLDGRLPRDEIGRFFCLGGNVQASVNELVAKGLWIEDGNDLVIVHGMDDQPTRAEVELTRRNDAARQRRKREGDAKAAEERNKKPRPRKPKPSRRDTTPTSDVSPSEVQADDPRDLGSGRDRTGRDGEVLPQVPEPREPQDDCCESCGRTSAFLIGGRCRRDECRRSRAA